MIGAARERSGCQGWNVRSRDVTLTCVSFATRSLVVRVASTRKICSKMDANPGSSTRDHSLAFVARNGTRRNLKNKDQSTSETIQQQRT